MNTRSISSRLVRSAAAVLILVVLTATATACGGDPDSLTVYSGRSEKLIGPIFEAFTAETGIALDVRYGSSNDLALLLAEEGD
ncbi:MAG: iron ABC transporter substrate-binding protein, partial [Acidimicrobiaceae bacterium]|nr:iron ABC transporter substrate-binding protein [Acidimicrobiaceae bacterium]